MVFFSYNYFVSHKVVLCPHKQILSFIIFSPIFFLGTLVESTLLYYLSKLLNYIYNNMQINWEKQIFYKNVC